MKFWLTQDWRARRSAGTSLRVRGSSPILQASAMRLAHKLVGRSCIRDSRSLTWVNSAAKSVRAAISKDLGQLHTRQSRIHSFSEFY
jgi:hypothetical protein